MEQKDFDALVAQFGEAAAKEMKRQKEALETALNAKYADVVKGMLTREDFDKFKDAEIKALNDSLGKLDAAMKTQGESITKIMNGETGGAKPKSLVDFFESITPEMNKLYKAKAGVMEITTDDMRKAGVVSFMGRKAAAPYTAAPGANPGTSTVVNMDPTPGLSPYLPGLGGSDLELFDVVRDPNFILSRVDVGTTNQSRLAWINELADFEGVVLTEIAEGAEKPQIQHKFQVEFSVAKKAGAWIELTEEFEDDLPGLATAVRRMLQQDVLRAFDNAIQAALIAVARPYEITGLNGKVPFPTLYDAIGAMLAQIGFYNFIPNTAALNPVTFWRMFMDKATDAHYFNPPFLARLNQYLVQANKVAVDYALVGDLTQYKVDIYKQFTLRIGWINDEFIHNKFAVLGEMRYHRYISDNRKKAICYNALGPVQNVIAGGSHT